MPLHLEGIYSDVHKFREKVLVNWEALFLWKLIMYFKDTYNVETKYILQLSLTNIKT